MKEDYTCLFFVCEKKLLVVSVFSIQWWITLNLRCINVIQRHYSDFIQLKWFLYAERHS